jgi:hypothetical protein
MSSNIEKIQTWFSKNFKINYGRLLWQDFSQKFEGRIKSLSRNINVDNQWQVVVSDPRKFRPRHLNTCHIDAGVHKNMIDAGQGIACEKGFVRAMPV